MRIVQCGMRRLTSLSLGLALVTALGCQRATESHPSAPQTILSENDQIMLAALTYLVETPSWRDYWQGSTETRFLRVNDGDPSPELLTRTVALNPPFFEASLCRAGHDGVFEKARNLPAILYSLQRQRTRSGKELEVHFFLQSVGWGGIMATLTLERIEGKWKVIREGQLRKA